MDIDTLIEELDDMGAEPDAAIKLVGTKEAYLKYLKGFMDNQDMRDLEAAVAAHDAKNGERAVHTLKGSALTIGLLPFADECIDMLDEYRGGNPEEAEAQMENVRSAFNKLQQLIGQVE